MVEKSNIAILHDRGIATFNEASGQAAGIVMLIREKHSKGTYPPHQSEAIDELLRRFAADPELFLIHVRNVGGASIAQLATDGGKHGMDGSLLPQDDARDLAIALTKRNQARDDLRANWRKLPIHEQHERSLP